MIEILRNLAEIYVFTFLTGFGTYRLLVPAFLRRRVLSLVLAPGFGLAQLAVVSGYCIFTETPIGRALTITTILGASTFLLALLLYTRRPLSIRLWRRAAQAVSWKRLALSGAGFCVFLVTLAKVLSPVFSAGMATTPYRIGIDQVGYAESAQYLVEGGTASKIKAQLSSELDVRSLPIAERQNYKDIHYETYVDSEFLLKADRWGYPGTLAALTLLTKSGHVYKLEFLLLIFGYALTLGMVFYFSRYAMRLPALYSSFVVLAVAFNCNLLNVYYEGQYAQIFAGPYFLVLLALYLRARSWDRFANVSRTTLTRTVLTFSFLTAALFSAFNESLVLLIAMVAASTAFDFVLYRKTNTVALFVSVIGFFGGAALVWPFSHAWIAYTVSNLAGLSRAGFWQPHWASLAEMLGLSDMYAITGYALQARSAWNASFNVVVSSLAACIILRLFFRARFLDRSFWLAPLAIVAAEYVKSHYVDNILNYPYMKLYTMYIPLLSVIAFAALYRFSARSGVLIRWAQYAVILLVVSTGSSYIARYLSQSETVTAEMLSLYRFDGARRFDKYAFLAHYDPNEVDIRQYMFVPLISMHWLNEVESQKYLGQELKKTILLVVRQSDLACRACVARFFAGHILYEDKSQLFIDTKLPVADFCDPAVRGERITTLGYNSQKQWVEPTKNFDGSNAVFYRQCDYGFIGRLITRASRSE